MIYEDSQSDSRTLDVSAHRLPAPTSPNDMLNSTAPRGLLWPRRIRLLARPLWQAVHPGSVVGRRRLAVLVLAGCSCMTAIDRDGLAKLALVVPVHQGGPAMRAREVHLLEDSSDQSTEDGYADGVPRDVPELVLVDVVASDTRGVTMDSQPLLAEDHTSPTCAYIKQAVGQRTFSSK